MPDLAIDASHGRTLVARLDKTMLGAVLILPLLLLHAHGFAELAIGSVNLAFLARSALTRDWAWARSRWVLIAWVYWGWLMVCSLPIPPLHLGEGGPRSLLQAILAGRFPILAAAMEFSIFRAPERRRWLYWIVAAAAAYIAVHAVFQFLTGYNLYGESVGPDGELTGPFVKPRAGPAFTRILLPAIVPLAAGLAVRPGAKPAILALLVLAGGVAVSLLIGQRMPFLLTCFGLAVLALLLPRLRWVLAAAAVAAVLMLAASPVVAPKAYYRLVEKFGTQMEHFASSPYGELYTRALRIGVRNPVTGLGADGFRTGCPDPLYFRQTFDGAVPDGGGAPICWHHPHNYYLEAFDNGGVPELVLFSALGIAWLAALGRGLGQPPDPLRASLLAATAMMVWPIASTTGFTAMPIAGWSFLLLGWGLAEARWPNVPATPIYGATIPILAERDPHG